MRTRGTAGVVLDHKDPNLARQHPSDYIDGATTTIRNVLEAGARKGVKPGEVVGIGIDTTGSTPMPVDATGTPLALLPQFANNPAALAWLWKDHTSFAEAEQITAIASKMRPQYLAKCGGRYSSEWFWAKILHCARVAPDVFVAAASWVEIADWIPAVLCGTTAPAQVQRGICAAGHKALFHDSWGGYPDAEFLKALDPKLERVRQTLPTKVHTIADRAGGLSAQWADRLGLPVGTPVAVGAFDVHLGAVGAGIKPGTLVKIMGTSTCDLMISPTSESLADVPGLCGIVPESVMPTFFGMEAGQSAVGDIFNWFVQVIQPGGDKGTHTALTQQAAALRPGGSGLLSLDWHNGNRCVLVDQRLTGAILGLTLHTTPAEIYRALIEATAFGARVIVERFEEYGVHVKSVICGGGIAVKNPMAMQIYADVFGRPVLVSSSDQMMRLGSAIAASVVGGAHKGFPEAVAAMGAAAAATYNPNPKDVATYERLYKLYRRLHDAFGIEGTRDNLADVMKQLLTIRDEARAH